MSYENIKTATIQDGVNRLNIIGGDGWRQLGDIGDNFTLYFKSGSKLEATLSLTPPLETEDGSVIFDTGDPYLQINNSSTTTCFVRVRQTTNRFREDIFSNFHAIKSV